MNLSITMASLSINNLTRGVVAALGLSILTAGCAAESNDPEPSPSTPPVVVADEAPAPPAETNASNAAPPAVAQTKTPDSAQASAPAVSENVVRAPSGAPTASTKTTAPWCRFACALCELDGHVNDCAKCHSAECR